MRVLINVCGCAGDSLQPLYIERMPPMNFKPPMLSYSTWRLQYRCTHGDAWHCSDKCMAIYAGIYAMGWGAAKTGSQPGPTQTHSNPKCNQVTGAGHSVQRVKLQATAQLALRPGKSPHSPWETPSWAIAGGMACGFRRTCGASLSSNQPMQYMQIAMHLPCSCPDP